MKFVYSLSVIILILVTGMLPLSKVDADALQAIQAAHAAINLAVDRQDTAGASAYLSSQFRADTFGGRWVTRKQYFPGVLADPQIWQSALVRQMRLPQNSTYTTQTTTCVLDVTPGDTQKLGGVVFAKTKTQEIITFHYGLDAKESHSATGTVSRITYYPDGWWGEADGGCRWEMWMMTVSGWREVSCRIYTDGSGQFGNIGVFD